MIYSIVHFCAVQSSAFVFVFVLGVCGVCVYVCGGGVFSVCVGMSVCVWCVCVGCCVICVCVCVCVVCGGGGVFCV